MDEPPVAPHGDGRRDLKGPDRQSAIGNWKSAIGNLLSLTDEEDAVLASAFGREERVVGPLDEAWPI